MHPFNFYMTLTCNEKATRKISFWIPVRFALNFCCTWNKEARSYSVEYCEVSSIVNEAMGTIYFLFYFIFFMKRLIHANKTQGYLYTFYASSCFFLRFTHKHKE